MGVVYHVKKVSKFSDENWSHNINLETNCSIAWKVIWKPIVQCLTSTVCGLWNVFHETRWRAFVVTRWKSLEGNRICFLLHSSFQLSGNTWPNVTLPENTSSTFILIVKWISMFDKGGRIVYTHTGNQYDLWFWPTSMPSASCVLDCCICKGWFVCCVLQGWFNNNYLIQTL